MAVFIVVMVSILAIGIGVVGLVSPARQVAFVSHWESSAGLWTSVGIRLVFGLALWFVAPAARTPVVFQGLAVLSVGAAFLLPCLGLARFRSILAWWCRLPPAVIRAWSVAAVAFGSFILWAVLA